MYSRSVECVNPCEAISLWIDEQCSTDHIKLSENCLDLIFVSIFQNWGVTILRVCSVSRTTWRYLSLSVHKKKRVPLIVYGTLTSQWTPQFWIWFLPCVHYLLKMRYYFLTSVTSKYIWKEKSGQSFSHWALLVSTNVTAIMATFQGQGNARNGSKSSFSFSSCPGEFKTLYGYSLVRARARTKCCGLFFSLIFFSSSTVACASGT